MCWGGGLKLGEGSRGLPGGGFSGGGGGRSRPTENERFSVFEMPLEGSPL